MQQGKSAAVITSEIAARTEPNTLDLVIALFSGAIGSIAICREVRGVVTSIPGVAIAVALMPPLCVVGYGIGVAISLNPDEGMLVARGGGLLFLTNLVAITFTAMLVFFLLHIDTRQVRLRVGEWRRVDRESAWLRNMLVWLPIPRQLRMIGSVPGRVLLSIIPIVRVLIPPAVEQHLRHPVGQPRHDGQVVADEDIAQPHLLAQLVQQVEHLQARVGDDGRHRVREQVGPRTLPQQLDDVRLGGRDVVPEDAVLVGRFAAERTTSLEWLRSLESPNLDRTRKDDWLGEMSGRQMLASWVAHDLHHIRQITRLRYERLEQTVAPVSLAYAGNW